MTGKSEEPAIIVLAIAVLYITLLIGVEEILKFIRKRRGKRK